MKIVRFTLIRWISCLLSSINDLISWLEPDSLFFILCVNEFTKKIYLINISSSDSAIESLCTAVDPWEPFEMWLADSTAASSTRLVCDLKKILTILRSSFQFSNIIGKLILVPQQLLGTADSAHASKITKIGYQSMITELKSCSVVGIRLYVLLLFSRSPHTHIGWNLIICPSSKCPFKQCPSSIEAHIHTFLKMKFLAETGRKCRPFNILHQYPLNYWTYDKLKWLKGCNSVKKITTFIQKLIFEKFICKFNWKWRKLLKNCWKTNQIEVLDRKLRIYHRKMINE